MSRCYVSEISARTNQTDQSEHSRLHAADGPTGDNDVSIGPEVKPYGDDILAVDRCCQGKCNCRCHQVHVYQGRFWAVQIPQFSRMLMDCDRPYCRIRRYRQSYRLALSRIGIPIAVEVTLNFGQTLNGYSISPSLSFPAIRKYTSPGFEVIWKLENCLISLTEAMSTLQHLFNQRQISVYDVDPSGKGWLEVLMLCSSGRTSC